VSVCVCVCAWLTHGCMSLSRTLRLCPWYRRRQVLQQAGWTAYGWTAYDLAQASSECRSLLYTGEGGGVTHSVGNALVRVFIWIFSLYYIGWRKDYAQTRNEHRHTRAQNSKFV